MSITAYKVEAVGHDRTGEDYGYVNIMYRYGNKQSCPQPDQCEKMEVMWADESVYGPPAPGSKVGDFIQTWLMGSWDCGVFTHREIAQRLMDTFTGLKIKELAWFENPREKTLKNGKPRARRAKWLPDREVDLVYLYSDRYLDARNPSPAETDFFTVTRMDAWGMSTWFMCTPEAAGKLIAMDYDTPFGMVFLNRILEKALAESGQNPVAHFLAGELLDFFACILQCFHGGDEMEHAEALPLFSDLLKEEYLWSEEYDEEEDEMRYEEDEVFPDDLFYSFYYYSWQAVKAYQDVLEQVPAEFAQPAAAVRELL